MEDLIAVEAAAAAEAIVVDVEAEVAEDQSLHLLATTQSQLLHFQFQLPTHGDRMHRRRMSQLPLMLQRPAVSWIL